jgi:hypothetical protein
MAMYKAANEELIISLPIQVETNETPDALEDLVFYNEIPEEEQVVEMHAPEEHEEGQISFVLPKLPGANDDEIVELVNEVSEKEDKEAEKDKSKASDQPKDLRFIKNYLDKIPSHRGETLGLERAESYLTRGLNMLSKMIQEDHDGKIDIRQAEEARIEMENGIDRIKKELNKRKKKAGTSAGEMTKEAQKIPAVGGIIVTVPLKISRIARVCINAAVSAGKDIEDVMRRQAEKWKLTDDEKADLVQLINDMGYYIRRDRGFMVDDKEQYGYSSENNFDLPPNYYA